MQFGFEFRARHHDLLVYKMWLEGRLHNVELTPNIKQQLISLLYHQILLKNKMYTVLAAIDRTVQSFQAALLENSNKILKLPQIQDLKVHDYE